jgi:hypothetical protein
VTRKSGFFVANQTRSGTMPGGHFWHDGDYLGDKRDRLLDATARRSDTFGRKPMRAHLSSELSDKIAPATYNTDDSIRASEGIAASAICHEAVPP